MMHGQKNIKFTKCCLAGWRPKSDFHYHHCIRAIFLYINFLPPIIK